LQQALANRQRAEALAQEYIDVTVQLTRRRTDDKSSAKKTRGRGSGRRYGSRSVPNARTGASGPGRLERQRLGGNWPAHRVAPAGPPVVSRAAQRPDVAVGRRGQPPRRKKAPRRSSATSKPSLAH
jgi:hypothetical protein